MKRLFTIAIIAMATSLTFAQAPLAKKSAASSNRLERIANVEEIAKKAKETKVLEAAKAEKAAAAKETGFSVLRRNSANRDFAMQMEETVINNWKPLNYRKALLARPFKAVVNNAATQEGNVTVTTDEHGIITDVTGVEPKVYVRATTGMAYFLNDGSMSYTAQSGTVSIIEDGDNVYIKNPITRYTVGSWVKGTKSGNIITVAAGQPLYYNSSVSATSNLRWGAITSTGSITVDDSHAEAFTFTVDGNVLTLEGTAAFGSVSGNAYYMGAFWSHSNGATGYGDAETVLTYDDSYVAPTTELVVLPTGAQADAWYMNAVSQSSSGGTAIKNQSVNVAFFDNDVYVQGISTVFPNAWVKGTISGNTVTFSNFQYVGKYSTYDCWFVGVNPETGEMKTVTATYDAEAKAITFADDVLINASVDDIYYLNWFSNVVVSKDEVEYPELVVLPSGAQTENWYMNGGTVEDQTEVEVMNQKVKVAFVDNDVYVQGITTAFPNAWVKGTIDGTTVTFAGFQFVGEYSGLNCWFVGVNPETAELKDATATYDATAKTITFADDVLINAAKDKIYYLDWFFDVVISEEKAVYEEPVITTLTAELPYSNTFDTDEEKNQAAIYDANEDNSTFSFISHSTTQSMTARYRYSTSNVADDYLVYPGLSLKAGKAYKVSVDAAAYGPSYPERLEVVAGKEAKASQFTIPVIAATEVATAEFVTLSNTEFTVEEDGTYYIAIHAISDKNMFYLYVDNFSVSELDESAPAIVSDLNAVADAEGANKAVVTFTVPTEALSGATITDDVAVVVKREGEEIYSGVEAAGAAVVINDDNVPAAGYYTYSVTTSYNGHASTPAEIKIYIGYDTPDVVNNIIVVDKSGSVDIAWDAPTGGAEGHIVNPADFKYNIYPVEMMEFWGFTFPSTDFENPYVTGLTETSANVEFNTNEGDHTFTYFAVTAENTTGESEDSYGAVVTGAPFQMPVFESVAGGNLSYWWGTACDSNNNSLEGGLYLGENASDGDNYCFQMVAETMGWINLQSGKIALAGTVNPTLTFDYAADKATPLTVTVITPKGEKDVATLTAGTEYASAKISLVEFSNEDWVRVIITGTFSVAGNAFIDNIRVYNMLDNNLVAGKITATSRITAGEDVIVTVAVENQGANVAESGAYTVDLYCNDTKVQSLEGTALASNAKTEFVFTEATNVLTPSELVWKAVVEFAADSDLSNNTTGTAKTVIKTTNYPTVTNLEAEQTGNAVNLIWSEPDMSAAAPTVVTDDFENYEGFTTIAGEWTFVDVDDAEIGGFQGLDFSINGVNAIQSHQSFWVHDITDGDIWNTTYAAHSGTKYLAAMFRYDDGTTDDWAISPVLSGNAQTISFYARSYSAQYPEKIEVLYSTGSINTADFISVRAAEVVPGEWTEYTAELPEGAKYFAIRSCATSSFMLMVDDVTYETLDGTGDLAIVGYNVYRDGVKLNAEPVEEPNYIDTDVTEGDHSYVVTVVYDKGESNISNVVTISVANGIEAIAAKSTKVSVSDKTITVANVAGKNVSISTADGKVVYAAAGSDVARVRVESGVYIVKAGNVVVKTIVK